MAFVLDADPTSVTMNCYATLAEADDYFAARFDSLDSGDIGTEVWSGFDEAKKTALLVTASRELDNFTYGGFPVLRGQPMQWPRKSMYDYNSYLYPSNVLPVKVKQACFELAYWRWTEADRAFSDTELQQLESQKLGPVDYVALKGAKTFPTKVIDLLSSIGPGALVATGQSSTSASRISL